MLMTMRIKASIPGGMSTREITRVSVDLASIPLADNVSPASKQRGTRYLTLRSSRNLLLRSIGAFSRHFTLEQARNMVSVREKEECVS